MTRVRTMPQIVQQSTARTSFAAVLLGVAAGMALLLSLVGTYGVIAYLVALRRQEISVRLALGATARQVRHFVIGRSVALALAGVAIGTLVAFLLSGFVRSLLFDVAPLNAPVYTAVAATLLTLSVLASLGPAHRAVHVDPAEVLRTE